MSNIEVKFKRGKRQAAQAGSEGKIGGSEQRREVYGRRVRKGIYD